MILQAEKRTPGSSAALRRAGRLPAVVYNRETNELLSVDTRDFDKAFRAQGTSSLITLELDGEPTAVLVKQVQMDKRRREPMHVDFYAITEGQVVDVHVPIELVGTPAGVREGGQLDVQRREVHISILPRLIPNHVELDISGLAIGDSLHVADVLSVLPPEARILDEENLTIVAVVPPRVAEEELEVAEEEAVEPEVVGRGGEEDEDEGEESAED
ncbi:MAG: 50S ribosomal protein L25 [Trueperaceae bacterium]